MTITSVGERAQELRSYAVQHKRRALINALSGGADSALSGAVSKAAECDQVKAVALNLPCSHDPARQADAVDARRVADLLGLPMVTVDLTEVWDQMVQLLRPALERMAAEAGLPLSEEKVTWAMNNLKPALRSVAGGAFADAFDGLTIGTDNVVENFLGYFSVRGDGIADRQPIRHLLKGEVRAALAEVGMPDDLVNRTPIAGLFDFENQTDEGEMGVRYADADAFVDWILREEAEYAHAGGGIRHVLLDESMTMLDNWLLVPTFTPCPVDADVADRIVERNQRTFFKRRGTDLRDTLLARGLI